MLNILKILKYSFTETRGGSLVFGINRNVWANFCTPRLILQGICYNVLPARRDLHTTVKSLTARGSYHCGPNPAAFLACSLKGGFNGPLKYVLTVEWNF